MAKTYTDYLNKVQTLVRDESKVQTDDSDAQDALDSAVCHLANFKLDGQVKEYTATGGRLYDLPAGWDNERSAGYLLEFPVDDTAGEVQMLDPEMSEIYQLPPDNQGNKVFKLRFRAKDNQNDNLPNANQVFRLHYPIAFILTSVVNTIPDSLFIAVTKLGARELCLIMSTRYAQQASGATTGDPADYRDKADKFRQLADVFYKDFLRVVAPPQDERPGRFVFGSFVETPLHRYARSLWPRDNSLRQYTDR